MPNFKLIIEYDGTNYSGWQKQENAPSVQETIETAIKGFAGETATLFVAGRTDAGVHAKGQVASFNTSKSFTSQTIKRALNYYLAGKNIVIVEVQEVDNDFNARFSAKKRYYQYVIINRDTPLALDLHRAWHVYPKLDEKIMQEAAQLLIGEHDFSTFRASECQARSPIKTIDKLEIIRENDHIFLNIEAPSFLHHQVRNIVGTLKLVGTHKWTITDFKKALDAKDRRQGGPTAPAHGLYFIKVDY